MPATLLDFLRDELALALARQPDDRARVALLARQYGVWTSHYGRFAAFGEQPFGSHPHYGNLDALDFANVLAMLNAERGRIEAQAVPA